MQMYMFSTIKIRYDTSFSLKVTGLYLKSFAVAYQAKA